MKKEARIFIAILGLISLTFLYSCKLENKEETPNFFSEMANYTGFSSLKIIEITPVSEEGMPENLLFFKERYSEEEIIMQKLEYAVNNTITAGFRIHFCTNTAYRQEGIQYARLLNHANWETKGITTDYSKFVISAENENSRLGISLVNSGKNLSCTTIQTAQK